MSMLRNLSVVLPWLQAARLHTLPLCFLCVGVGAASAAEEVPIPACRLVLTCLTACSLQILSNLSNDLNDFLQGADNATRVGPLRTVQLKKITPSQMKKGIMYMALFSLLLTFTLLYIAFQTMPLILLLYALLAVLSVLAAIFYTAPPLSYGYKGWGDLFVFVFFGVEAVLGTYFLFVQRLPLTMLLPAAATGLLCTTVLNVNNMRDLTSDKEANKRSIPVRVGMRGALAYEWSLLWLSIVLFHVDLWAHHGTYPWGLLPPTVFLLWVHARMTAHPTQEQLPMYFKQNIAGVSLMLLGYIVVRLAPS